MAIRTLRQHGVTFTPHEYRWEDKGARGSAEALGVDVGSVVKTLVFETHERRPLLALMDGAHEVSTKALARFLGLKDVAPVAPKRAEQLTGYQVGGISPFGTRTAMRVYIASHLQALPTVYINGGKRGFLVQVSPADIQRVLNGTWVEMAA
jgi:Cys-tRNA(Pro) deacylase